MVGWCTGSDINLEIDFFFCSGVIQRGHSSAGDTTELVE